MKLILKKRKALIFIALAVLLSLSIVGVIKYNYIAYPPQPNPLTWELRKYPEPDPEGDWLDIRESRLELEELHANGSLGEKDYQEEKAKLIETEDEILRRFLKIKVKYEEKKQKEAEEWQQY